MPSTGTDIILAIDLGTSGPKVALVTPAGEVLGWERESLASHFLPDGGVEQDPEEWWRTICQATRKLLARALAPVESIVALVVTAQWSGTVAVDGSGRHLMNAITWMDARGAPYVQQITHGPVRFDGYGIDKVWRWIRRTGGLPTKSGKDSVAHILFIKHNLPDIYARTHKFLEPKDYLNLRLTGNFAASYDSITLHWVTDNRDIHNIDYDPSLLALAGLDRAQLPDLKRATDVLGPLVPQAAADLGLGQHVQVMVGTPDVHAAAVGSGALENFAPHLYLGTSSWLTCHVPFKKTDLLHNMASLPSPLPGRYLLVNEQEIAGGCLNFLRDNLFAPDDLLAAGPSPDDTFARFDRMAATVPPGSGGVLFTPWLNGERTPVDDHLVRGGFHNLSLHSTRSHLVRAVLEGVAFNTRWLLSYVERFVGQRLGAINMVGGGAVSPLWCQMMADVLDRTIHQVRQPVAATVRGAAMLASIGLGYFTPEELAATLAIDRTFVPAPGPQAVYARHYAAFLAIYKQNKSIHRQLNGRTNR